MKSKTSFFNKTILKKNFVLFWPIWGIYLAFNMLLLPIVLWMEFNSHYMLTEADKPEAYLRNVEYTLRLGNFLPIIFGMAVITAMALFHYLFVAKNTNMIHSLPVTRGELYRTNVFSGLMFLWIPEFIAFLCGVLVCLNYGMTRVEYLAQWLVYVMGISFFFYALAVFCAMFTGQLFTVAIYYVIVNVLYYGAVLLIQSMFSLFSYGAADVDIYTISRNSILSPILYLARWLGDYPTEIVNKENELMGLSFGHLDIVGGYALAAVVIFALSYAAYQKRSLEKAGDLLTFTFVKPIFRWGVGVFLGMFGGFCIQGILSSANKRFSIPLYIFITVVCSVICYYIAEMFIKKTFKVFCKKRAVEGGAFVLFVMVICGGIYGISDYYNKKVPELSEVKRAYISSGITAEYEGEEIQEVIDIHKEVLKYPAGQYVEAAESNVEYTYFQIGYVFQDGKVMKRHYRVPLRKENEKIVAFLDENVSNPEHMLEYLLCVDYEKQLTKIWNGTIEPYYAGSNFGGEFGQEDAQRFFEALLADIKEGNIKTAYEPEKLCLDGTGDFYMQDAVERIGSLYLCFSVNEPGDYATVNTRMDGYEHYDFSYINDPNGSYYDEGKKVEKYFSFTEKCTHIIDAMVEAGYIDSAEEFLSAQPIG